MIAADSSSLIAYLQGEDGRDRKFIDDALIGEFLVIPPIVLTELRSDPKLDHRVRNILSSIPVLEVSEGYWERAGKNRSRLLQRRLRARLADTLIAQSCIDHKMPLITRDSDFRHFAKYCGLRLL